MFNERQRLELQRRAKVRKDLQEKRNREKHKVLTTMRTLQRVRA